MWCKIRKDKLGYDYFSHHVDDFLFSGQGLEQYMKDLEKSYTIPGQEVPKLHLGMDIKIKNKNSWELGRHSYVKEVLEKVKNAFNVDF